MRRLLATTVLCLLAPVSALAATEGTQVGMREFCSFRLLPNSTVLLRTTMTVSSASGGRTASVRFVPGWSVGRVYPKGDNPLLMTLRPGQTVRRTTSRTVRAAPRLWQLLRGGARLRCASSYTLTIPAGGATAP